MKRAAKARKHYEADCQLARECLQAELLIMLSAEVPDWVHDAGALAHNDKVTT